MKRPIKITPQVTNRDGYLALFFNEISKIPLLTQKEEIELARKIKKYGAQEDIDKLVKANLRFVVSVAKQYQNLGLSLQDLVEEGAIGMIEAAERFDESRGFKFISYAVWWIRQGILKALAENAKIVRLPLNQQGNINKVFAAREKLAQQYEREPTPEEIREYMILTKLALIDGNEMTDEEKEKAIRLVSLDQVKFALTADNRPVRLDAPLHDDDLTPNSDVMLTADRDDLQDYDRAIVVGHAIDRLTEREAVIIRMYYGIGYDHPHTLEEIGDELGLTRERIRQVKVKAERRLKYRLGKGLNEHL